MSRIRLLLGIAILAGLALTGCPPPPSTQIVIVGESFASGAEAVREANNLIASAAGSGCEAISVGGYGAGGEGLVIGVPVLLDCPLGTQLPPPPTP